MEGTIGDHLAEQRRLYADEIAAVGGIRSKSLLKAFSLVPREDFLPPGPWIVEAVDGSYYPTEDASVPRILHSVGVCLDLPRILNNGNPARIGRLLEAVDIKPGETVFHIGTGMGYYTAIIAHLVGENGRVIASEIDPALREQARRKLAGLRNIAVVENAQKIQLPAIDVIFSSAGMTTIPRSWTNSLTPGGRMLLPMTGSFNSGYVFLFSKSVDTRKLKARQCAFMKYYPCMGDRDLADMQRLDAAMSTKQLDVAPPLNLWLDPHEEDEKCWLHREDYCLRFEE